jgi:hypothetical protein
MTESHTIMSTEWSPIGQGAARIEEPEFINAGIRLPGLVYVNTDHPRNFSLQNAKIPPERD